MDNEFDVILKRFRNLGVCMLYSVIAIWFSIYIYAIYSMPN